LDERLVESDEPLVESDERLVESDERLKRFFDIRNWTAAAEPKAAAVYLFSLSGSTDTR
jgi:hypothetical protein